jgi:isopenicillin-N N-acyltransferase-like protein
VIQEFTGTARERGRQHGESLRAGIRARIERTLPARAAVRAGPWLAAIDQLPVPLGEELRGIAESAGVPLADVVLLNAFEAFDVARQVELGGCTAVAVGGVLAQNWDANGSLAETVGIHLHRGPDIPATVLVASPGGLGWIGMTGHGLALVNNDLLTPLVRAGVPSQAARRHALAARTADAAAARLVAAPPVGGRAYLLADAAGAVVGVELAAEAGARVTYHAAATAHTNHALDPAIAAYEDAGLLAQIYPSSRPRLARARALLDCDTPAPELLADHDGHPLSICRHPAAAEPTVTAASVIFDCAARRARIALGNPCATPYQEITLDA